MNNNSYKDLRYFVTSNVVRDIIDGIQNHQDFSKMMLDAAKWHDAELKKLKSQLQNVQSLCSHTWQQTAEGRHGSDKGTAYYTCTICGDAMED